MYLTDALTRIVNGYPNSAIDQLLPRGLSKARPQSRGLRTTLTLEATTRALKVTNWRSGQEDRIVEFAGPCVAATVTERCQEAGYDLASVDHHSNASEAAEISRHLSPRAPVGQLSEMSLFSLTFGQTCSEPFCRTAVFTIGTKRRFS
jgi:hypothetical protein